jgi:hypothetical protein
MTILSNTDALLVAVPMIGLLVAGHFRLDELVFKPRKSSRIGRGFAGGHRAGEMSSIDPDGMGRNGKPEAGISLPPARGPRVRIERE